MKHPSLPLAAALLLATYGCNSKPPLDPAIKQAMETRHKGFEQIGDAMKKITDTMKSGGGLDPELAAAAQKIDELAPQLKDWFPAGSGPESGRKTGARPEIWTQPEPFARKREALATAAARLAERATANDAAGFATQVGALGKTCKSCHDDFRKKDH